MFGAASVGALRFELSPSDRFVHCNPAQRGPACLRRRSLSVPSKRSHYLTSFSPTFLRPLGAPSGRRSFCRCPDRERRSAFPRHRASPRTQSCRPSDGCPPRGDAHRRKRAARRAGSGPTHAFPCGNAHGHAARESSRSPTSTADSTCRTGTVPGKGDASRSAFSISPPAPTSCPVRTPRRHRDPRRA